MSPDDDPRNGGRRSAGSSPWPDARGLASGSSGMRSPGVTATRHGEGTTSIALGLARALATPDTRVLLVEANLRTPALAQLLRLRTAPGLAEFLAGELRAPPLVRPSGTVGLSVIRAGARAAAVDCEALVRALAELAPSFDSVVLDLPPLDPYPDALHLAPALDGVMLVVDPEATAIGDAERSITRLTAVGARLFGLVLNARQAPAERRWPPGRQGTRSGAAAAG